MAWQPPGGRMAWGGYSQPPQNQQNNQWGGYQGGGGGSPMDYVNKGGRAGGWNGWGVDASGTYRYLGGGGGSQNPWQSQYQGWLAGANNPYRQHFDQLAGKAMQLGNRDWTKESVQFAREDVGEQQRRAQNQLRSYGMDELSLRKDVQSDWTDRMRGAVTKAQMSAQEMQRAAYQTATDMVRSASGAELDYLLAKLQGIQGGSADQARWLSMMMPMMEKYGYYGGLASGNRNQGVL